MSAHNQSAAIIICTRDRPADLVRCLESIENQSVIPDEVLVVLGSPESCPPDLCKHFDTLPIRLLDCDEQNISKARNAGLSAAGSEIAIFIDDDARARADWIQSFLNAFDHAPESWAIGGDVFDSRSPPPTPKIEFSRGLISSMGRQIPVYMGSLDKPPRGYLLNVKGCNFALRRQQVMELGGFDPFFAFAFDESDLMLTIQAAGARVVHEPAAAVDHDHTPGHFRQRHPMDRDWRIEYASHTMFMLKHTPPNRHFRGRLVIYRRLLKLVIVGSLGVLRREISIPMLFNKVLRDARGGIRDAYKAYASNTNGEL